ncbi:MAG TPA: DJ-1 family glyoxalase III [Planctomycetota bacterium]|nr:DJ-1 family glyoxalase III [Planctomycetota bacterium]
MAHRVLVLLADGFEEIEAVTIIDVLRRAGAEVVVAGLSPGMVRGAHGIEVRADTLLDQVESAKIDMLVLPGGQPGARNLEADGRVLELVRELTARERTVAAICAAPSVLAAAGVLEGQRVTSHPSVRARLASATVEPDQSVVRSGSIVTSQGVGTALEFALELAAECSSRAKADELARAMVVRR